MNSFYLLLQKAVFGAMSATTFFVPSHSSNGSIVIVPLEKVAMTQKDTNNLGLNTSFDSRMRRLSEKPSSLLMAGKELQIILADTDALRIKGLSGSTPIAENHAMFFLFDKPDKYGFWMKDMLYSIDIIWVNIKGQVIHIVHNANPESFPKVFKPTTDAIAVIEVKSGLTKDIGLTEGEYISFKDISATK